MKFDPRWDVVEAQFSKNVGHYESLFALANGYLGTRGATEEAYWGRTPGTYLAGLFDALPREVTELPNLPDWVSIELELAGERFNLQTGEILAYHRVLRLKTGVLERMVRWKSPQGRVSQLHFSRFVSIADNHAAGLRVEVVPENYSGTIRITSRLDGQVTNSGSQHLAPVEASTFGERGIYMISETYQHKHLVVQGADHCLEGTVQGEGFVNGPRRIDYWVELEGKENSRAALEKLVSTFSSRDLQLQHRLKSQELLLNLMENENRSLMELGFAQALHRHQEAWAKRWSQADLELDGPDFDQLALRFASFHLMQMASWDDYRVSVAAKGLSGEGYRGHVFWDTEIFIFPFFLYLFPEVARLQLRYRHHTLPGALRKAKENGYEGAMYPWESADTGDETTPKVGGIDFKTKKPIPILTGDLQQHITADIAFAISHYLEVTGDREFLAKYGAEIVLLGARFWASRVEYSPHKDRYEIRNVMGPDEYKEHVNDNYYTNYLVQKHLQFAQELLRAPEYKQLAASWNFTPEEGRNWGEVAVKLHLPKQGELIEQYDGFFKLREIDVLKYRDTPGALQKVYSWREINESQVLKQADTIMLFHLFFDQFSPEEKRQGWDYYEPRTMHDSSLSAAIHSIVASDLGLAEEAYRYFAKASRIDLSDGLTNSAHGLHAASLGGLWQAAVHGFAGVRVKNQKMLINPRLPEAWSKLHFRLQIAGRVLEVTVTSQEVLAELVEGPGGLHIQVGSLEAVLKQGSPQRFTIN